MGFTHAIDAGARTGLDLRRHRGEHLIHATGQALRLASLLPTHVQLAGTHAVVPHRLAMWLVLPSLGLLVTDYRFIRALRQTLLTASEKAGQRARRFSALLPKHMVHARSCLVFERRAEQSPRVRSGLAQRPVIALCATPVRSVVHLPVHTLRESTLGNSQIIKEW